MTLSKKPSPSSNALQAAHSRNRGLKNQLRKAFPLPSGPPVPHASLAHRRPHQPLKGLWDNVPEVTDRQLSRQLASEPPGQTLVGITGQD